ncbi:hypothetical protein NPIL_302101 [Nephila pilipes]|uniref:Uncharacterized protein n=1 Tax=Nephila pilipes TaxID=299642 RepID=A0A8X6IJ21_NEPPI|nr:hypothetical protein NPIL_302101 [Nephila pilipes]
MLLFSSVIPAGILNEGQNKHQERKDRAKGKSPDFPVTGQRTDKRTLFEVIQTKGFPAIKEALCGKQTLGSGQDSVATALREETLNDDNCKAGRGMETDRGSLDYDYFLWDFKKKGVHCHWVCSPICLIDRKGNGSLLNCSSVDCCCIGVSAHFRFGLGFKRTHENF